MRRVLSVAGRDFRVEVVPADPERTSAADPVVVRVEGIPGEARARPIPGGYAVTRGRVTREAGVAGTASGVEVSVEGLLTRVDRPSLRPAGGAAAAGAGAEARAPMPGKVVRVLRGEGDPVRAGEGVLVLEAMKMQNEIRSPADGVVATMRVAPGASLAGGESLFTVAPAESGSGSGSESESRSESR